MLSGRFSLAICFMQSINTVYVSIPVSQFLPPPPTCPSQTAQPSAQSKGQMTLTTYLPAAQIRVTTSQSCTDIQDTGQSVAINPA